MFTKGFVKTSADVGKAGEAFKSGLKSVGSHLKANRKDYMMGAGAAGAVAAGIGANRKKK